MSYENIGTPTGNNLYITIPLRGTQNWDQKLKDGFFIKVSEHDHTPGKGAAIVEAALDAALQAKVAAIATNTSEIAQNATNIQQNAAEILTNAQDISSNDTDIAALDSRMTQAESDISSNDSLLNAHTIQITQNDSDISDLDSRVTTLEVAPPNSYTLNSTNAQSTLPSYLSNADVLIDSEGVYGNIIISGKEFENVRFSLDAGVDFQNCTFRNCFISEGDDASIPFNLILTECNAYATQIFSMATVSINKSNFHRGDIKSRSLNVNNTNAGITKSFDRNVVNLTQTLTITADASQRTYFRHNDVKASAISFVSNANDNIYIDHSRLDTLTIQSDNYYLTNQLSSATNYIVVHENNGSSVTFKFRDSSSNDIVNVVSGNLPAFKIVDGVYSVYDKGLVPSGTPSDGDTLVYNSTSGEWEVGEVASNITLNTSSSTTETISNKNVIIDMGSSNLTLANKTFEDCNICVKYDAANVPLYTFLDLTFTDCVFTRSSFDSRVNPADEFTYPPTGDAVNLTLNLDVGDSIHYSTFASRFIYINGSTSGSSNVYSSKFVAELGITASTARFYQNCLLDTNLRGDVILLSNTSTDLRIEDSDIRCAKLVVDVAGNNTVKFSGTSNIECDSLTHYNNSNATSSNRLDIADSCYFFIRKGLISEDITRKLVYLIGSAGNVFDLRNNDMPIIYQNNIFKPAYGKDTVTLHNDGNIFDTGTSLTGTIPFYYGFLDSGQPLGISLGTFNNYNAGTCAIAPQTNTNSPSGATLTMVQTNLSAYDISNIHAKIEWNVPAGLGSSQYVRIIVEYRDHAGTIVKTDTYTKALDTGILEIEDILQGVDAETVAVGFNNDVTDVEFDVKYFKIDFKG